MSTELVRADKEPAQRPVAIGLAAVAGVLTIIWRLIPHPANCLPLGAMGIHGSTERRTLESAGGEECTTGFHRAGEGFQGTFSASIPTTGGRRGRTRFG